MTRPDAKGDFVEALARGLEVITSFTPATRAARTLYQPIGSSSDTDSPVSSASARMYGIARSRRWKRAKKASIRPGTIGPIT